jgi:PAS domain-containing protein
VPSTAKLARAPAGVRTLDALGVAVCLADARDPEAPLLYVNPAFEELTGWSSDEALGHTLDAVLGAGDAPRPGTAVLALRRRDGSKARCELTITEVEGAGCWAIVLVDAALVDTVLRVERDRAQSYLDVASTLLVILYADGTVGLLNHHSRELLGDLDGENWHDKVVPPADRDVARRAFERLVGAGEAGV